jgi:diguanylate cyclase (GGDEF)-like protein
MSGNFPIIPILIATALIMLVLALFAWRKRFTGNAAIFLSLSMLGVAFYSFGYAMELASDTFRAVMFWVRFQHLGIFLIIPNWLLFALSVSGYKNKISLKLILLISIIPVYIFLSAQTLGWLNLAHHNPRLETLGPYQVLAYDRNAFNYITIGYYTLCMAISTLLFVMMFFRAAPSARKHLSLYLIGSLPPWATTIVWNLNLESSGLDYTPLFLGGSALFFAFGFLRFRILDLLPLARNAIFEDMTTGVVIANADNQIVDFNPAFTKIFPEVSHAKRADVEAFFRAYPELRAWLEGNAEGRVNFTKNEAGVSAHYRVSSKEIADRRGQKIGKIYHFYENTQEKLLQDKLEVMATHDGLTGIYNRQHFDRLAKNELSRIKRYGGELSLAMIDLDKYKRINDTYGHGAGDQVLIAVAQTLQGELRKSDVLARFGGEEFVILLPETDSSAAKSLCGRLQQKLVDQAVQYDTHQIKVRASFGVTTVNGEDELSLEAIYKSADKALYKAKDAGGNTVCVNQTVGELD